MRQQIPPQQAEPQEIVPMSSPDLGTLEMESVLQVLRSSRLSQGPFQDEFEKRFAAYLGRRSAVAVSSGTAGLHLTLRAAGVGPGDLVFTTPFSFVATANAVIYLGARPVFVDVEEASGNLDPAQLEEALRRSAAAGEGGRCKALLPVHVFGRPADMTTICEIAERHRLPVVEDACEALGSEHAGRKAGTFGGAAVFGFYPNKQITCGEGGMIVTDHDDWAEQFRSWRNQGRAGPGSQLLHERLGYNYRLDEMSAALGVAQMKRIEELLSKRAAVAGWYQQALSEVDGLKLPEKGLKTTRMSWFVYVVRIASRIGRDRVRSELRKCGIPSRVYFPPIHLQPYYQRELGWRRGDFPHAERLGDESLALPFSGTMSSSQVEKVAEGLKSALSRARRK